MDKKCAAIDGNCFADFDHRSCRSLQGSSCRLLPASPLADSDLERFGKSLTDYHPERSIIVSPIFPRPRDQSLFRLATNSNCDAHTSKSPMRKSELQRLQLLYFSHGEHLDRVYIKHNASGFIQSTFHSSLLTWVQCRINARRVYDSGTN